MTKVRCPLSIHGVIEAAIREAGGPAAVTVILPERSERWLYAATDPDVEERRKARLTYDDVRAMTAAGVTAFVHDLARLAGMYATPMPAGDPVSTQDQLKAAAHLMREAGEAVTAVVTAHADGVLTAAEAAILKRELLEVSQVVNTLLFQIDCIAGG